ncbi:sodium-dependent bicarbonate transport family permease [Alcanivorax sp.]|uniref:sodium-dependent bicarbonate transport family permease n=1 Tax=Alcanivorax sp. TaxID=1872427 RepID=UPI0025C5E5C0|nr:sodium-dependent bicarbonate transport family permease [Alcanivorax sp.]
MQLDAVVLFFVLGLVAGVLKVRLPFPTGLYQSLTLFLLLAIGLKGGAALAEHASARIIWQSLLVIGFGAALPLLAFPLLRQIGGMDKINAAAIAAHYGSVSVATYAVAVAVLDAAGVTYEAYLPLFVVLLEIPAIIVGLILARGLSAGLASRELAHETLLSPGIVLMVGGLLIGAFSGDSLGKISPFFMELFQGVLALFLLKMGLITTEQLSALKQDGPFLAAFGIFMPLLSGALGALLGHGLGLSVGGVTLLAVLGASASYIAVPAAMRVALPQANPTLSMAASLGISFPFNVLAGIPLYLLLAQWLQGSGVTP